MSNSRKRAADQEPEARKRKKKTKHRRQDETLNMQLGINTLFSHMDPPLLADYLVKQLTKFGTDLSPIEISDLTVSGRFEPW